MANMFSGKSNKFIPKSLDECTQRDATVTNLHVWSERLEKWGKIFFWILIVYGVIMAITSSIISEEVIHDLGYKQSTSTKTTFDYALFLTSIAETGLYAFLEYCAYHVLALLISSLALITQNTIISANVALYEASNNSVPAPNPDQKETTPQKATVASDLATKLTQEENAPRKATNQQEKPVDTWVCNACGTNNSTNYGQCKKCGKFRS